MSEEQNYMDTFQVTTSTEGDYYAQEYVSLRDKLNYFNLVKVANGIYEILIELQCVAVLRVFGKEELEKYKPFYLQFDLVERFFLPHRKQTFFESEPYKQVSVYLQKPAIVAFMKTFEYNAAIGEYIDGDTLEMLVRDLESDSRTDSRTDKQKFGIEKAKLEELDSSEFVKRLREEFDDLTNFWAFE